MTMILRRMGSALFILTLLASGPASAKAGLLKTSPNYNGFIFGNSNQTSDTEGRLAVMGNAVLTNYGVGSSLAGGSIGNTLVVGGNLTYNNGQVFQGDARVGGSASVSGFGIPNGTLYYGTAAGSSVPNFVPHSVTPNGGIASDFFSSAKTYAGNLSSTLAALSTTGSVNVNPQGYVSLVGAAAGLNVFNITNLQLDNAKFQGLSITTPAGSTVVVNVRATSGDSTVTLQDFVFALNGVDKQHVVYNFVGITQITNTHVGIEGSVLAPGAAFLGTNGNVEGDLAVGSISGSTELHNFEFKGVLPNVVSAVPEPSTLLGGLFAASMVGLGAWRRRRTATSEFPGS